MLGTGTIGDPYIIEDIWDLQNLGDWYEWDAYYELGGDIDASPTLGWDAGGGQLGFVSIAGFDHEDFVFPTSQLSSSGNWVQVGCSDFWDGVDEDPHDGNTSYIKATTASDIVWLGIIPPSIVNNSVDIVVTVYATVACLSAATARWEYYLLIDGVEYYVGGDYHNSTSWKLEYQYLYDNPATGLGWTTEDVSKIQGIGIVVTDATPDLKITQVKIGVESVDAWSGNFNGKGYTISNLYMDYTGMSYPAWRYPCLFDTTNGAVFHDITFEDIDLTAYHSCSPLALASYNATIYNITSSGTIVSTHYCGGGIAGYIYGDPATYEATSMIWNCHSSVELFGYTGGGGAGGGCFAGVEGCEMWDCYATGDIVGGWYLGGLIGTVDATAYIHNCYATGNITGTYHIGGFVGDRWGAQIDDCYCTGDVIGGQQAGGFQGWHVPSGTLTTQRCYATGNVSGSSYLGGFVGTLQGWLGNGCFDCYARGNVTGSGSYVAGFVGYATGAVIRCYSTGLVTGGPYGFAGQLASNEAVDDFWDTETSGKLTSAGGAEVVGETTVNMKTESTFTDENWDFVSVWTISPTENDGYPTLLVFASGADDSYGFIL